MWMILRPRVSFRSSTKTAKISKVVPFAVKYDPLMKTLDRIKSKVFLSLSVNEETEWIDDIMIQGIIQKLS